MGWGKVVSPILKFAAGKTLVWSKAGGWKVLIKEVTSSKIWFSSLGWSTELRCVLQVNRIECENLLTEERRGKDSADDYCSPRWSARARRSRWGSCPSPSLPSPAPLCWCCRHHPRRTHWTPATRLYSNPLNPSISQGFFNCPDYFELPWFVEKFVQVYVMFFCLSFVFKCRLKELISSCSVSCTELAI